MEEGGHNEEHIIVSEKDGHRDSGYEEPVFSKEEDVGYQSPAQALVGSTPPDGGLRAWLVVIGAWCTSVCSFGWINSTFLSYMALASLKGLSKLTIGKNQVLGRSRIITKLRF